MKSLQSLDPTHPAAMCLALLLVCNTAAAQQVYRCGNRYSQTPCAAGAVPIRTQDPRTEAQQAAARDGAARDKALADEMEAARHRDEAMALSPIQKKSGDMQARATNPGAKHKEPTRRTGEEQAPGMFTALSDSQVQSTHKKAKPKAKPKAKASAR